MLVWTVLDCAVVVCGRWYVQPCWWAVAGCTPLVRVPAVP